MDSGNQGWSKVLYTLRIKEPESNSGKWLHLIELVFLSHGDTFESSGELTHTSVGSEYPRVGAFQVSQWVKSPPANARDVGLISWSGKPSLFRFAFSRPKH